MSNSELKPIDEKTIRECVEDFGKEAKAHVTMGQLLDLVEKESAAQARIQELEGVCDNYNSMCSQQDERIKELEAQVERLQKIPYTKTRKEFMKSWGVDGMPLSNIRLVNAAWDRAEWLYNQSLEAVKREAIEQYIKENYDKITSQ